MTEQNTGSRMVRASFVRVAVTLIGMATGFLAVPYIVSGVGPAWYGVWVTISSVVASYHLLDLGLAAGVMRYIAQALGRDDYEAANVVINTALVVYSFLACVLLVITAVLVALVPLLVDVQDVWVVRAAVAAGGVNLALTFPSKAFAGVIQAKIRYDLLAFVTAAGTVITAVACVVIVRKGGGIVGLAVTTLVTSQVHNLAYIAIARHLLPTVRIHKSYPQRELFRSLLGYSSWVFVIDLANQLRHRVDALLVAWLFSATAVTYFAVGAALAEHALGALSQATNFATPVLTQMDAAGRREAMREAVLFLTRLNVLLAGYAGMMLFLFAEPFIVRWMDPSFASSAVITVVLGAGLLFDYIHNPLMNAMYATGKHQRLAVANVVEAGLNVICSVALSYRYGVTGIALGTTLPLIVVRSAFLGRWGARLIGLTAVQFYSSLIRPLAVSAVSGAVAVVVIARIGIEAEYLRILGCALVATAVFWPIALFGLSSDQRNRVIRALPMVRRPVVPL